ncbi:MAG: anaerobic ribonucleoside-triphosphate reductase, partial [Candidatus Thorarchaeota archaeon]
VHDQVMEQHTFLTIPSHLADAHLRGDIYIKDREYFSTRDYCATWDLRQIFLLGIAPDGLGGVHSSAAGPARHLSVAINHAAIWLAAAQSSFAGGQGYFYFNTFLAPFLTGKSYDEIKQAAQQLVFTLTQQYVARGGQVIFSSVDLTPGIPRIMRDVPAVLPGGKTGTLTYADFEDEANRFFDAFMEVMIEGDANGKAFNFPKPNIVLRKEFMKPEFDDSWHLVAELTAKFGSPYFENYLNWRSSIEAGCSSCCSHLWTASSEEELEEFLTGNMVFGASQMVTPNFGRAAWIGRADEDRFFAKLDEYLELCKEVILEKKRFMDKLIASGSVPFYTQPKPNGDPLIDISKREFLIGTVGFEEMVHILTDHHLHESEGARFGIKVLKYVRQRADEFHEETGLNFGVTRTPAESAAGRLARKDWRSYPGIRKYLKGTGPTDVYYTNSTTLDVAAAIPLSERIKKEGMFHPYLDGGALTHIYLGEANPNPDALWSLTKKIATQTLNAYWAFTKDILSCPKCYYQTGIDWRRTSFTSITELDNIQCPRCGYVGCDVFSRVTGYVQSVATWNSSKKQEFINRHRYAV